ncbi:hypothetical protein J5J83_04955 [Azoarcus sp. L1K30]|uniref:hypothetical protein n=1 Tax=Azoarcus sp. L1K30 TaxID=2820277 RepID=UPI001B8265D5|nr:hypothetical protein [Azoarcus sp. L1K30]MBR0565467.1 hypothetical protein [Azoarcus sp. L1K30]
MSGYLHQLAARSLGLVHSVRSRATLPLAAPLPESAPPTAVLPIGLERAPNESRHTGVASPRDNQSTHASFAQAHTPATTAAPLDRQGHRDIVTNRTAPPADNRPNEPTRRGPALEPATDATIGTRPASEAFAPAPGVRAERGETRPLAARPASPHSARPPAIEHLDALVARLLEPVAASAAFPAADLPTVAATSSGPTPAPAASSRHGLEALDNRSTARAPDGHPLSRRHTQAPPPGSAGPPDVHITIGRLEVNPRPLPPTPAPRPRGPAPLSLADYLARRSGERR